MYLNEKSADVCFYVPDRELDGYGINKTALDNFDWKNYTQALGKFLLSSIN